MLPGSPYRALCSESGAPAIGAPDGFPSPATSIACQRQRNADDSQNEDGDSNPERPSFPALCRQLLFPKPSDGKVTLDVGLEGGRPRAHRLTAKRLELGAPLAFLFSS